MGEVHIVILAMGRDFGRDLIASRVPTALWPVAGKPVLQRLICNLAEQGVKDITICCDMDSDLLRESVDVSQNAGLNVKFLDEPLPVGTAGLVREAAKGNDEKLLLVLSAAMICPVKISDLVAEHYDKDSDLTVVFNPDEAGDGGLGQPANIYLCEPAVLKFIPEEGYCDIKESLIPELLRLGKRVRCITLPRSVGNFRDRQGYLNAVDNYLENASDIDINLESCERNKSHIIWKGPGVVVEPGARIYGRVVLLDDVHVEAGAVIFGPAILGRNVKIGSGSVVVNSVLWDDSQVGDNCEVQRCVVDYNTVVPDNSVTEDKGIAFKPKTILKGLAAGVTKFSRRRADKLQQRLQFEKNVFNGKGPNRMRWNRRDFLPWLAAGVVLVAFLWSYWPGIMDLWNIWQRSDEYSSGILVPFLAIYLLWSRRDQFNTVPLRPSLWGIPAFVGAQAVRFFGLFFMFSSAERLSVVLSIAALVLLLFGWEFFRKVSTIMLFLFLMLPWPNRVQAAISLPLQEWSTSSAVFCLETFGYEVLHEGNVIHIGQVSVAVAEACNGLRMITAFFVISGLVVLLVKRPWWEKLIVFISSLPVALFCNTLRLAVTAIAFTALKGEYWEKMFHDFGGYAMMPLALAIVVGEFWFLAKLTTPPKEGKVVLIKGTGLTD
jgi:exosortase